MPASTLELPPRTRPAAGWVVVHPAFRDRLAAAGLLTAAALLDLPGEVVSGHPDRHVVRVELPGWERALYLKRQHRVTLRERLRQWRAGFGWRSRCGREAAILTALEAAGLPTPPWVAHGEDAAGRAFLLVEELTTHVELRRLLGDTRLSAAARTRLAGRIGRSVAAVHAAGFDTPDLTAKHVFVRRESGEVVFIDWQSARRYPILPAAARLRALAALHASLVESLATPRERLRFLRAYSRAAGVPIDPRAVERIAAAARGRRSVRDQRQPTVRGGEQRLVWLAGEAVCAVPDVAATWPRPAVCPPFYDTPAGTVRLTLPSGRPADLARGTCVAPWARLRAWVRGRPWRSPGAVRGRVLFHLARYGLPAPRLLAFGQRLTGPAAADWFVLAEPAAGVPLADWLAAGPPADRRAAVAAQCTRLLDALHAAGCRPTGPVFWVVASDRVGVGGAEHVRIVRTVSPRDRRRDAARVLPAGAPR